MAAHFRFDEGDHLFLSIKTSQLQELFNFFDGFLMNNLRNRNTEQNYVLLRMCRKMMCIHQSKLNTLQIQFKKVLYKSILLCLKD